MSTIKSLDTNSAVSKAPAILRQETTASPLDRVSMIPTAAELTKLRNGDYFPIFRFLVMEVKEEISGQSKHILRFGSFKDDYEPIMKKTIEEITRVGTSLYVEPGVIDAGVVTRVGPSTLSVSTHEPSESGLQLIRHAYSGEPVQVNLR
jgi:hypothetical protein